MTTTDNTKLYRLRLSKRADARDEVWKVLCHDFFQRYVPPSSTILDVGAGWCYFVNNIEAGRKIAVDLNPEVAQRARPPAETLVAPTTDMQGVADSSVDVAFVSNLFEHLTRDEIVTTLDEIRRVLRPGGRLLILQPNVRYCGRDYWQFFDHITPIDDRALVEVLGLTDFTVVENRSKFLPYTAESRLPLAPGLVRLYLKVGLAQKILGKQAFLVAEKRL
jgi:SAM-dependent methyltransferase